jgi:hypothetical protein
VETLGYISLMSPDYQQLAAAVQRNCHISDARHAGNYTLCVYLLKMREYYRWEKALSFSDKLSTEAIGDWLSAREAQWEVLEDDDYAALDIAGARYAAFDASAINTRLRPHRLVYSAGFGQKSKPHFFLGELERTQTLNSYTIFVSAREYARDLTSPPAMSQGNTIYIRRESFKRMIWEKTEEWRWHKPQNAMAKAIAYYDFERDVESALSHMTDNELESAILHEIGEIRAGEDLPGWGEMMQTLSFTQAEIMARAVRDHIADAISTLPVLLEREQAASIHFYFANLTNMRKHIMPALQRAYQQWQDTRDTRSMLATVVSSQTHWRQIAKEMLALHARHGNNSAHHLESLVKANPL